MRLSRKVRRAKSTIVIAAQAAIHAGSAHRGMKFCLREKSFPAMQGSLCCYGAGERDDSAVGKELSNNSGIHSTKAGSMCIFVKQDAR